MTARKKTTKKKASKKSSALVPVGSQSVTGYDYTEEFSDAINEDAVAASGDVGWTYFKTQGGVFVFNEEELGKSIEVSILGAMRENLYYEGGYDPSNPSPPVCFALGKKADELAPPEELKTKQADKCSECPMNVFGTAEQGRGKACKNQMRLAVLPWIEDAEELSKLEGARLRIPVTAIRPFAAYVNKLTKGLHMPLLAAVTRIETEGLKTGGWTMTFEPVGGITDQSILKILKDRREEAEESLRQLPIVADPNAASNAPRQRRRKVQPRKKKKETHKKAKRSKAQA